MNNEEKETQRLLDKFPAIVAWGRELLSYQYFIENQVHQAEADGAPVDAIYERSEAGGVKTGKWVTVRDLYPDHPFRVRFEADQAAKKGNQP